MSVIGLKAFQTHLIKVLPSLQLIVARFGPPISPSIACWFGKGLGVIPYSSSSAGLIILEFCSCLTFPLSVGSKGRAEASKEQIWVRNRRLCSSHFFPPHFISDWMIDILVSFTFSLSGSLVETTQLFPNSFYFCFVGKQFLFFWSCL